MESKQHYVRLFCHLEFETSIEFGEWSGWYAVNFRFHFYITDTCKISYVGKASIWDFKLLFAHSVAHIFVHDLLQVPSRQFSTIFPTSQMSESASRTFWRTGLWGIRLAEGDGTAVAAAGPPHAPGNLGHRDLLTVSPALRSELPTALPSLSGQEDSFSFMTTLPIDFNFPVLVFLKW